MLPPWDSSRGADAAAFDRPGMALASVQRREALQVKVKAALAGEAQLSGEVRPLLEQVTAATALALARSACTLCPLCDSPLCDSPLCASLRLSPAEPLCLL